MISLLNIYFQMIEKKKIQKSEVVVELAAETGSTMRPEVDELAFRKEGRLSPK